MPSSPSFCGEEWGSSSKEGRREAACASILRFLLGGVDRGVDGRGMLLSIADNSGRRPWRPLILPAIAKGAVTEVWKTGIWSTMMRSTRTYYSQDEELEITSSKLNYTNKCNW